MKLEKRWRYDMGALGMAAMAAMAPPAVLAQAWPGAKPIRMLVGVSAGGTSDMMGRMAAKALGDGLGQVVVVENRVGASGNIAAEYVARSAPDGYTLQSVTSANAIKPWVYRKLTFDFIKDFDFVAMMATVPNILMVTNSLPARDLREFVAYVKANPGKVSFASAVAGASGHLSGEMFKSVAGLDVVHVHYKGAAPAIADLVGGHVPAMFDNLPTALIQIRAGKVRAIAVTSLARSPAAPEVPTIAESGYPGFDMQAWFAVNSPAGLPRDILQRLNSEINKFFSSEASRKMLLQEGAVHVPMTPEQYRAFNASETEKWGEAVRRAGGMNFD